MEEWRHPVYGFCVVTLSHGGFIVWDWVNIKWDDSPTDPRKES